MSEWDIHNMFISNMLSIVWLIPEADLGLPERGVSAVVYL